MPDLNVLLDVTYSQHAPLLADFSALLAELKRWATQANNSAVIEAVSGAAAVFHKVQINCFVFYCA